MTTRDGAALGEADTTAARRLKTLEAIQQRVLWLSTLIMHHANHVRSNTSGVKSEGRCVRSGWKNSRHRMTGGSWHIPSTLSGTTYISLRSVSMRIFTATCNSSRSPEMLRVRRTAPMRVRLSELRLVPRLWQRARSTKEQEMVLRQAISLISRRALPSAAAESLRSH